MAEENISIETKQGNSLAEGAMAVAASWGLEVVAKEARDLWNLTGEAGDSPLRRISSLPVASLLMLEHAVLITPNGQEIKPDEILKGIGEFLYPNPITWRTVVGGIVGAVIASAGFRFKKEWSETSGGYETARYIRGQISLGGPIFGAIAGSSLANHFFEQHGS